MVGAFPLFAFRSRYQAEVLNRPSPDREVFVENAGSFLSIAMCPVFSRSTFAADRGIWPTPWGKYLAGFI